MKRWLKRIPMIVAGLGVLGLVVWAFLPQPVGADFAVVARGPLRITVDEDGKTRIKERYVVSAPLSGRLLRIHLDPGDVVEPNNTLLAVIEPTDPALLDPRSRAEAEARVLGGEAAQKRATASLARATTAESFARSEVERARPLVGRSVSTQEMENMHLKAQTAAEELRAAQFAVQVSEFEYKLAQAALLRTRPGSPGEAEQWRFDIHSPIQGRVLRVFQESATIVSPGTKLLELGDPRDLEIEIDVLSTDAVKIPPRALVLLEHWGGGEPLHGRVRLVEPAAFTKISALGVEEQRVWVIVDLVDPVDKRPTLGDAYRVEARIVVWESESALKVPSGALFRREGKWATYVVVDGRAKMQLLQIGHNNGLEAEVLEGLKDGDQVIVHPSDKIRDGVGVAAR